MVAAGAISRWPTPSGKWRNSAEVCTNSTPEAHPSPEREGTVRAKTSGPAPGSYPAAIPACWPGRHRSMLRVGALREALSHVPPFRLATVGASLDREGSRDRNRTVRAPSLAPAAPTGAGGPPREKERSASFALPDLRLPTLRGAGGVCNPNGSFCQDCARKDPLSESPDWAWNAEEIGGRLPHMEYTMRISVQ